MRETFHTADLSDDYHDRIQCAYPIFKDFGGRRTFHGPIKTLKVFEDNSFVRNALESPGHGQVLVIDGGASLRCALLGDNLAQLAIDNGWAGILVNGCIRDAAQIAMLDLGIKALNTCPIKSFKKNIGEQDLPVSFGGIVFSPGHFLYADLDGVVVAPKSLA